MGIQISSLNTVYPNWTGPSLQWRPYVLGAALNLWLRCDAGFSVSAGRISSLVDQSANAYLVSQANPASQLLYTSAAQNNLPGISNDSYGTSLRDIKSSAYLPAIAYEYNQPFSISFAFIYAGGTRNQFNYLLGQYDPSSAANYKGIIIAPGSTQSGTVPNTINLKINGTNQSAAIVVSGSTTLVAGRCYAVTITYSGNGLASGVSIYVNGGAAESLTVLENNLGTTTLISTAATCAFLIADSITAASTPDIFLECFYTNSAYSSSDVSLPQSYLNSRYAAY